MPRTRRLPRWIRAGLALALGCALVGVVGEFALRWLLFGEVQAARELGRPLRAPQYWARSPDEDDYWKLMRMFASESVADIHGPDPTMGWIREFVPGTLEHPDESDIGERRPVLLFGDSFSQCTTSAHECWQGLLEHSDLASDLALLNYGVGGYGLDQMVLLCERALPRFAARDPIVVLAVLVDDDLERCSLSFREHPKPRFRLAAGELQLETPGTDDSTVWLKRNPPSIPSYMIRLLENVSGPRAGFTAGWTGESTLDERRQLARALLDRVRDAIAQSGVEHWFVLLFHGEQALQGTPRTRWQEELLTSYCREHGIPYVSSRPYLEAALSAGAPTAILFEGPESPYRGHYTAEGNRVAFDALLQGLKSQPEADTRGVRDWTQRWLLQLDRHSSQRFRLLGHHGRADTGSRGPYVRVLQRKDGTARLSVRPGDTLWTEVTIELEGAKQFRARVRAVAAPGGDCAVQSAILFDSGSPDGPRERKEFPVGAPEVNLQLEGLDGDSLHFRVHRADGRPDCVWLQFDDVRMD